MVGLRVCAKVSVKIGIKVSVRLMVMVSIRAIITRNTCFCVHIIPISSSYHPILISSYRSHITLISLSYHPHIAFISPSHRSHITLISSSYHPQFIFAPSSCNPHIVPIYPHIIFTLSSYHPHISSYNPHIILNSDLTTLFKAVFPSRFYLDTEVEKDMQRVGGGRECEGQFSQQVTCALWIKVECWCLSSDCCWVDVIQLATLTYWG